MIYGLSGNGKTQHLLRHQADAEAYCGRQVIAVRNHKFLVDVTAERLMPVCRVCTRVQTDEAAAETAPSPHSR